LCFCGSTALLDAIDFVTLIGDDRDVGRPTGTLRWPSLARALEREADRWALWLPVWVGLGISVYFSAPTEPVLWAAGLSVVAAYVAWRLWRHGTLGPVLMAGLAAAAVGFGAAALRTHQVAAPFLAIPMKAVAVTGTLETVEVRPERGPRLTLTVEQFGDWPPEQAPRRIRVSLLKSVEGLAPGMRIKLRADLSPPARPVVPGGYDFARAAFFQQIGAVGFTFQAPEILPDAIRDTPSLAAFVRAIDADLRAARAAIAERIRQALPGQTGAIASALITGERGPISEATEDAFRDSGLAHLLVISGLHMAIVTGAAFLFLRSGLALVPSLALRLATKKWAAIIAAVLATAYLLISGGAIATVRAYVMVLVMLVAVLLDRPAIALRNVAIAALIILLIRPESLLSAGFQMSFAAVVALVAAYEAIRDRGRNTSRFSERGRLGRAVLWIAGIGLTTVIASAAVAPIAAYHFQRSQQYALLANIIAGPVMNIWVMPFALLAMLAMPFGLEGLPLWLMGQGIALTQATAQWIAGLPGAMILVPAMPWIAFVTIIGGGLWLAIWRRRWRLWGVVLIAGGLASAAVLREPPDILVGRDADVVAVREAGGALAIMGSRGRWVVERWLLNDGDSRDAADVMRAGRKFCDANSCTMTVDGRRVTLTKHPRAFADDCAAADVLIVGFARAAPCQSARLVIDQQRVTHAGAHAIQFRQAGEATLAQRTADLVRQARGVIAGFLSAQSDPQSAVDAPATTPVAPQRSAAPLDVMPTRSGVSPAPTLKVVTVDDLRGARPWVATREMREAQWQLVRARRRTAPDVPTASTKSPAVPNKTSRGATSAKQKREASSGE
jgi:competence protein ComEC